MDKKSEFNKNQLLRALKLTDNLPADPKEACELGYHKGFDAGVASVTLSDDNRINFPKDFPYNEKLKIVRALQAKDKEISELKASLAKLEKKPLLV